jgi:hypothetical protein
MWVYSFADRDDNRSAFLGQGIRIVTPGLAPTEGKGVNSWGALPNTFAQYNTQLIAQQVYSAALLSPGG